MNNFLSKSDYQNRIERAVKLQRLDTALLDIETLVDKVFCEPLNVCEIFGDRFLDDMCQQIGRIALSNTDLIISEQVRGVPSERTRVVFIASKLQASGGHTAVLADIAKLGGLPATILITRIGGKTDLEAIVHRFSEIPNLTFELAPRGSRLSRLEWLQRRLIKLCPSTVWLFNHHQDSVAVAAVQPDQGYAVKYLHHGDHHLCLGVYLGYGEHYDPHPMGFRNCREALGISANKYLPMVAEDLGAVTIAEQSALAQPLITCTAAGKNKIEVDYWLSYSEVIPAILNETKGVHVHIGRLSNIYRLRIWLNLFFANIPPSSFVYIAHVDSVWNALKDKKVDLYISSFPYAGARTLVEVLGAGIPVAMHSHSFRPFLSVLDMAPEGAFVWRQPSELYRFLAQQSRHTLCRRSSQARAHYDKYHSKALLVRALREHVLEATPVFQNFEYRMDTLQKALATANSISFFKILKVFFLRQTRRYKTKIG